MRVPTVNRALYAAVIHQTFALHGSFVRRAWLFAAACFFVAACSVETSTCEVSPVDSTDRFLILASDYASSELVWLNSNLEVSRGRWFDSGTCRTQLSLPLSGDVVLPTQWSDAGRALAIDRFNVDAVLSLALGGNENEASVRQFDARGSAFRARVGGSVNAQDVLQVGDVFWISRHNPIDEATESARGNDLLLLSPSGEFLQSIPFRSAMETIEFDGQSRTERIFDRPVNIVSFANGAHLIALAGLSLDFRFAGEGRVAWIRAGEKEPRYLPLPSSRNCGAAVSAGPNDAFLLCSGPTFDADGNFASEAQRLEHATILRLSFDSEGMLMVHSSIAARNQAANASPSGGLVAINAFEGFVVARGSIDPVVPDRLLHFDFRTGAFTEVDRAHSSFVLGRGLYDAASERVLIPEASAKALWRYRFDAAVSAWIKDGETPLSLRLPPRELVQRPRS